MPPNQNVGQRSQRSGSNRLTHSLRRRNVDSRSPVNPFVKYSLFFVNFLLLVVGIAAIVFSSYVIKEKNKPMDHFVYFAFDPACWVLLFGCIITLLNMLGAYGSLRENITVLKTYYILFSLILLVELLVLVFVFVFFFQEDAFADMGLYPEDTIKEAIVKYRDDDDMRGFIDDIQDLLSCCGYSKTQEGYLDWNDNRYFNCSQSDKMKAINPEACSVPYSCCKLSDGEQINYQCGKGILDPNYQGNRASIIYTRGCLKGLEEVINDNIWYIGGGIIILFFAQMVFIWFAKALVSQIEEQKMKW